MIPQASFEIFAGSGDNDAMWLETVEGLANARQRMEGLAAQVPGQYFVYSIRSRAVLAKTDTTKAFTRMENRTRAQGAS